MADIAMLVVEEYERRVRSSRKAREASTELASCVSVLAQKLKDNTGKDKMESLMKWVEEPKSQIGLEASHGFFSA